MISNIIQSIFPLSADSLKAITDLVTEVEFEKGSIFIEERQKNNDEYFVLEGICRSFLLNPDGEEVTISFFMDNSVLSPYLTRTTNGRSNYTFQALSDLKLGAMNASDFETLMVENLEIREFGNSVLRKELHAKVEKEISMATSTAAERLIKFRRDYPMLENLVPHPAIASFLGITNVSLSRLRKELLK